MLILTTQMRDELDLMEELAYLSGKAAPRIDNFMVPHECRNPHNFHLIEKSALSHGVLVSIRRIEGENEWRLTFRASCGSCEKNWTTDSAFRL